MKMRTRGGGGQKYGNFEDVINGSNRRKWQEEEQGEDEKKDEAYPKGQAREGSRNSHEWREPPILGEGMGFFNVKKLN